MVLVDLKNIKKSFLDLDVIYDVSFDVLEDEILCIIGPSGCGKTTLLRMIAGFESFDSGSIVQSKNLKVSYIFQEERLLPWLNVFDNIKYVLDGCGVTDSMIYSMLSKVGLKGYEKYYPSSLSGGMRSRVAIVRAFLYPHDLILMDEPFKSLDSKLKFELLDLFVSIVKKKKGSVVFVTHDGAEAKKVADRIIYLSDKPSVVL
jgi:NitT/TauT family transport system ATP-binding protein